MRRRSALASILLSGLLATLGGLGGVPARAAETGRVTIAEQYGLGGYPPTVIMRHGRLVERRVAEAAGVKGLEVRWLRVLSGAAANDTLISGNADYVGAGIGPLLTLWDKTRGTPLDVRALGGRDRRLASLALLTTSPGARAIADLTPADRVALPAVRVSQQAVLLQIAADKLWGPGQHERLDTITLSLPHSEAVPALLSGAGGITAHFSNEPFQTQELRDPRVRVLTTSYDILGGPTTVSALYGTSRFRDANPGVNRFVFEALAEAQALIARDRTLALRIVLAAEPGLGSKTDLRELLASPTVRFSLAPQNTHQLADFMHRVGRLKTRPESWRDYFFPEAYGEVGG